MCELVQVAVKVYINYCFLTFTQISVYQLVQINPFVSYCGMPYPHIGIGDKTESLLKRHFWFKNARIRQR